MSEAKNIAIHGVTEIRAKTPATLGAPLILMLLDKHGIMHTVTLFVGDQDIANRLCNEINDAVQA